MEGALQHGGVTLTPWQQANALREERERVRILDEMEASSKMYAMLAKLPPCYPPSKAYTRRDGIAWCTRL
jgi:hypothetical protein